MPNYAQAVPLLLASFAWTSSATSTGGDNEPRLVKQIKNTKKEGLKNKEETCTMDHFLSKSQYTNCGGEETEVVIACDYMDDTATATTKEICTYSEQPVPVPFDDSAAATAVGCGDHGSFDPEAHLSMDRATGMCQIKFFRLTSTCIGYPAKSGFGVMVEVPHKDNSEMLLQFSADDGATFYNAESPRTAVSSVGSSTRRKLDSPNCEKSTGSYKTGDFCFVTNGADYCWNSQNQCPPKGEPHAVAFRGDGNCGDPCTDFLNEKPSYGCVPACMTAPYKGVSLVNEQNGPFQTCFKSEGSEEGYCWTNSVKRSDHVRCVPHGISWRDHVDQEDMPDKNDCGKPCQKLEHARPVDGGCSIM